MRLLIAAILVSLPLGYIALAQDEPASPGESPATRHAQVIAQGVLAMPGDELVWRVTAARAMPPGRATPTQHPAGFVLADEGEIALVDALGEPLARLAPGEATWIAPGSPATVVSLERHATSYYEITLQRARALPGEGQQRGIVAGDPFAAPPGDVFDVDLIRDVLQRDEESAIPAGSAPAMLLVTDGTVFVLAEGGEVVEVPAGEAIQVAGDVTVTGASRRPAAFVVARIGSEVSPSVRSADATPALAAAPAGTPLAATGPASVTVTAAVCPALDDGADLAANCSPAEGLAFSIEEDEEAVQSFLADAAGGVVFADIKPGGYTLLVGIPADFAPAHSRVRCVNAAGGRVGQQVDLNLFELALAPGDVVACDWYILPGDVPAEAPSTLTVDIRLCPPGMTAETLFADACEAAPPGTTLSLLDDGVPLGVAAALPEAWVWSGIEPGTYGLDVNAVPEGVTEVQLDGEPCCGEDSDFAVSLENVLLDERRTLYLFQPAAPAAEETDADEDGLTDDRETAAGTNPYLLDSDGDALRDGDEVDVYGTDPLAPDTDGDGIGDAAELLDYETNPFLADTDGDGVSDSDEIVSGSDPLDGESVPPTPASEASPEPDATPVGPL